MRFRIISKRDKNWDDQWTGFLQQHPDSNPFQTPEMYALAAATKNWNPIVLICADSSGNFCGVVLAVTQKEWFDPLGLLTGRTIVWGGPLIIAEELAMRREIFSLMLKTLRRELRFKSLYTQFRNLHELTWLSQVFRDDGYEFKQHLNFIVDINGAEEVRKRMSKSKLNQIRKSLKNGAEIVEPDSIEKVRRYYEILKNLYKTRVKKPLPDWSFFREFFYLSRRNDFGKFFLIQYHNEIIGGIICPIAQGKSIYEWYICGQDNIYKNDGIYPSVLATWAPIEYALNNGLKFFDFMGAGHPAENYGVREFKSKFGGRIEGFGRFERIDHKSAYYFGRFGFNLLKRI